MVRTRGVLETRRAGLVFVHDIRELNGEYLTAGQVPLLLETLVAFAQDCCSIPRFTIFTSRILKRAQKMVEKTEVKIEPVLSISSSWRRAFRG